MKIVVCVKQVPDTMEITIDRETGVLNRDKAPAILNPFDAYAIEEGLSIKEQQSGSVTALTMGPPAAVDVLYEAMSMGVDDGIHVCDNAFRGSDTYVTAKILAAAINKIGNVDLVLCGKQAIDGDTAQVGPEVAEMLGIPHVAYVKKIRELHSDRLIVERVVETGIEIVEIKLPALLTVLKDINMPRLPSFKLKCAAKKCSLPVWGVAELGMAESEVGLEGSPTTVMQTFTAEPRGKCEMLHGTQDEIVATLLAMLNHGK